MTARSFGFRQYVCVYIYILCLASYFSFAYTCVFLTIKQARPKVSPVHTYRLHHVGYLFGATFQPPVLCCLSRCLTWKPWHLLWILGLLRLPVSTAGAQASCSCPGTPCSQPWDRLVYFLWLAFHFFRWWLAGPHAHRPFTGHKNLKKKNHFAKGPCFVWKWNSFCVCVCMCLNWGLHVYFFIPWTVLIILLIASFMSGERGIEK